MSAMASGYGRGGRGAALLQALNTPVRKPGEQPPGSASTQPPPATLTQVSLSKSYAAINLN